MDKFRIAAVIVLGIAAIIVLVSGRREPACGRLAVRETLVRQIGDRLYDRLGAGQAYELTWRPELLAAEPPDKDGVHVCRAGFDYAGPDGSGLMSIDYSVARPGRGRDQVRLTDMRVAWNPAGPGSPGALKPDSEARNF